MGMPVKQGEKTQFYVVGVYKYDMLQEVLNGIHVGRSGRAHILGPQGELVAYEDKEAILQGTKLSQIRGNSYQKIESQLISGATGVVEAFANGEDVFVLCSNPWHTVDAGYRIAKIGLSSFDQ